MAAAGEMRKSSRFYVGEVKKNLRDGNGKLVMKDGSYYEGEFKDGEINGNGLRYWASTGNTYSGQFCFGELHGHGVMQYGKGGQYEGEFSYGLRDGHGCLFDKEGNAYQGSFHKNKKHGEGQIAYSFIECSCQSPHVAVCFFFCTPGHAEERMGQWRNDLFNGHGTMIHSSGIIYEGQWINGQPACAATKIVIEGGDVLEVFQDSFFNVEVQLQDDEGQLIANENGRLLKISAGVRFVENSVRSSSSALLRLIEDMEEKPMLTPFGFECVNYPLMEVSSESEVTYSAMPNNEQSEVTMMDSSISKSEVESQIELEATEGSEANLLNRNGPTQFSKTHKKKTPKHTLLPPLLSGSFVLLLPTLALRVVAAGSSYSSPGSAPGDDYPNSGCTSRCGCITAPTQAQEAMQLPLVVATETNRDELRCSTIMALMQPRGAATKRSGGHSVQPMSVLLDSVPKRDM
ncbi:MORN1 protein, partial [Polypterus senegalus]